MMLMMNCVNGILGNIQGYSPGLMQGVQAVFQMSCGNVGNSQQGGGASGGAAAGGAAAGGAGGTSGSSSGGGAAAAGGGANGGGASGAGGVTGSAGNAVGASGGNNMANGVTTAGGTTSPNGGMAIFSMQIFLGLPAPPPPIIRIEGKALTRHSRLWPRQAGCLVAPSARRWLRRFACR